MITVIYSSIDRVRIRRRFASVAGATNFAHHWVGPHPEIGSSYAISGDGVGKIEVIGATLAELFPSEEDAERAAYEAAEAEWRAQERAHQIAEAEAYAAEHAAWDAANRPHRSAGCNCSDEQLVYVGCDCIPF